jgi:predicted nucleic acid-binding protein
VSRPLVFVDTNVLVYLRDSQDPEKQRAAAEWMGFLWETRSGRISPQVLQEYYVTVTARLRPGLSREEAREDALALRSWNPPPPTPALMEGAWQEEDRWGLSFWDSMIVASARLQGCAILLTEDLSHGQDLDGLLVTSPFRVSPQEAGLGRSSPG